MKKSVILWVAILLIFLTGYYLRVYLPLHTFLPYSPYEAFTSPHNYTLLNCGPVKDFSDKPTRYPTTIIFQELLNPVFGNLYILYIFGGIVMFFLGKEISGKNIGGFLAFSLFALANENLIQYTRTIGSSGLCYVFMWAGFLFLIKYLKSGKNSHLAVFIIFSVLALTSYHTGASALAFILFGMLISLFYSSELDKKLACSLLALILFHIIWILIFDISQLNLLIKLITGFNSLKIFYAILAATFAAVLIYLAKGKKFLESEYFPLLIVIVSAVLIFSKFPFFDFLLSLGVKNYYISTITLNNYLAQVLLTHVYLLFFLPFLIKEKLKREQAFLRGWLIGLIIVSLALVFNRYYSRVFDYSFPMMFVLFGAYWTKKRKFRIFIVTATIILLMISQLVIYKDPFTMRRYYTQDEVESAENIIALNLNGTIVSDLRTSALFSYLGKKDIKFADAEERLHDTIFYEYQNIEEISVDYVVLSESMKNVVYSTNFPTKPINSSVFNYYKSNYKEVYNEGLMYVYEIR